MTRREWLALAGAKGLLQGQSSLDSRGAARDLAYQALELLSAQSSKSDVERAISMLKGALDQDPSFGDAYYYRQLCLKRLGENIVRQQLDAKAAERYESEGLRDQRDPFILAVPRIYENLGAVGQKWALVVGVSRFNSENGASPLQYADSDATAFAAALRDPGIGRFPSEQVMLLTNDQATTPMIKARLNTIARRAKPEDLVVVYISTHGSARSDDLRRVSYLLTYDTNVTSRDLIFGSALPMVEISGILGSRCVAQRTVAIFDTCHSGAAEPGQALSSQDLDRLREGAGRYILSSCQADQLAYEADGNGYFTASLIRHLGDRRGCVRLSELFTRVQQDVADTVQKKHGKEQRPIMAKSESAAEIVIGTPPGQAPDACTA
jgi:hypothetical protein